MSHEPDACFQRKMSLNVSLRSIMMQGMVIDMNDAQLHGSERVSST
jgi:hypothetical protein